MKKPIRMRAALETWTAAFELITRNLEKNKIEVEVKINIHRTLLYPIPQWSLAKVPNDQAKASDEANYGLFDITFYKKGTMEELSYWNLRDQIVTSN